MRMIGLVAAMAGAFALAGCDTVTEFAIGSKDAAVKYIAKGVDRACSLPLGVRGEVIALSNAALASKGSPARVGPALDCDGNGIPDLLQ
jgi:hypothetical protein